jgi:hypothetical protein
MWMAEWLFTDFFDLDQSAPGERRDSAGASFYPAEASLTDKADDIENGDEGEQHQESKPEEQFRGDQLADKVKLKKQEDREDESETLAEFRLLYCFADEYLEIYQTPLHVLGPPPGCFRCKTVSKRVSGTQAIEIRGVS